MTAEFIIFLIFLIIILGLFFLSFIYELKTDKKEDEEENVFPKYYHLVNILDKNNKTHKAWLAVNDDNRFIWTVEDEGPQYILYDEEIVDWWE